LKAERFLYIINLALPKRRKGKIISCRWEKNKFLKIGPENFEIKDWATVMKNILRGCGIYKRYQEVKKQAGKDLSREKEVMFSMIQG
jgi:hypothetical protein